MKIDNYLNDRLDQLHYDKEAGVAYGSIRLAADLAGLAEGGGGLGKALKQGAYFSASKLATYLMTQGFEAAYFLTDKGIPADVITEIIAYYADKDLCGEKYVTLQAPKSMRMLAQIGLTVAIKQAIGVAVDDRLPAVSADVAAMMQMFMQQQTQIAEQSVQIQQLLAAQTPQQTVKQQVVKRTGVAAEIQSLRCESAQLWARDGQRDPNGAKQKMALIDAKIQALLIQDGDTSGYLHQVTAEGNGIGTGIFWHNREIFRPLPLAPERQIRKCETYIPSKTKNPTMRALTDECRRDLCTALDTVMIGFDQKRLLHGGLLYHAIYTEEAKAQVLAMDYRIGSALGWYLKLRGWRRATQKKHTVPNDCIGGLQTYPVYEFVGVPTNG
jgi:hypothetical protein